MSKLISPPIQKKISADSSARGRVRRPRISGSNARHARHSARLRVVYNSDRLAAAASTAAAAAQLLQSELRRRHDDVVSTRCRRHRHQSS